MSLPAYCQLSYWAHIVDNIQGKLILKRPLFVQLYGVFLTQAYCFYDFVLYQDVSMYVVLSS
jgi:hypothetical protein